VRCRPGPAFVFGELIIGLPLGNRHTDFVIQHVDAVFSPMENGIPMRNAVVLGDDKGIAPMSVLFAEDAVDAHVGTPLDGSVKENAKNASVVKDGEV
jgi:hypothetical protein